MHTVKEGNPQSFMTCQASSYRGRIRQYWLSGRTLLTVASHELTGIEPLTLKVRSGVGMQQPGVRDISCDTVTLKPDGTTGVAAVDGEKATLPEQL